MHHHSHHQHREGIEVELHRVTHTCCVCSAAYSHTTFGGNFAAGTPVAANNTSTVSNSGHTPRGASSTSIHNISGSSNINNNSSINTNTMISRLPLLYKCAGCLQLISGGTEENPALHRHPPLSPRIARASPARLGPGSATESAAALQRQGTRYTVVEPPKTVGALQRNVSAAAWRTRAGAVLTFAVHRLSHTSWREIADNVRGAGWTAAALRAAENGSPKPPLHVALRVVVSCGNMEGSTGAFNHIFGGGKSEMRNARRLKRGGPPVTWDEQFDIPLGGAPSIETPFVASLIEVNSGRTLATAQVSLVDLLSAPHQVECRWVLWSTRAVTPTADPQQQQLLQSGDGAGAVVTKDGVPEFGHLVVSWDVHLNTGAAPFSCADTNAAATARADGNTGALNLGGCGAADVGDDGAGEDASSSSLLQKQQQQRRQPQRAPPLSITILRGTALRNVRCPLVLVTQNELEAVTGPPLVINEATGDAEWQQELQFPVFDPFRDNRLFFAIYEQIAEDASSAIVPPPPHGLAAASDDVLANARVVSLGMMEIRDSSGTAIVSLTDGNEHDPSSDIINQTVYGEIVVTWSSPLNFASSSASAASRHAALPPLAGQHNSAAQQPQQHDELPQSLASTQKMGAPQAEGDQYRYAEDVHDEHATPDRNSNRNYNNTTNDNRIHIMPSIPADPNATGASSRSASAVGNDNSNINNYPAAAFSSLPTAAGAAAQAEGGEVRVIPSGALSPEFKRSRTNSPSQQQQQYDASNRAADVAGDTTTDADAEFAENSSNNNNVNNSTKTSGVIAGDGSAAQVSTTGSAQLPASASQQSAESVEKNNGNNNNDTASAVAADAAKQRFIAQQEEEVAKKARADADAAAAAAAPKKAEEEAAAALAASANNAAEEDAVQRRQAGIDAAATERQEQEVAATRIQAMHRGRVARAEAVAKKKRAEDEAAAESRKKADEEASAAVKKKAEQDAAAAAQAPITRSAEPPAAATAPDTVASSAANNSDDAPLLPDDGIPRIGGRRNSASRKSQQMPGEDKNDADSLTGTGDSTETQASPPRGAALKDESEATRSINNSNNTNNNNNSSAPASVQPRAPPPAPAPVVALPSYEAPPVIGRRRGARSIHRDFSVPTSLQDHDDDDEEDELVDAGYDQQHQKTKKKKRVLDGIGLPPAGMQYVARPMSAARSGPHAGGTVVATSGHMQLVLIPVAGNGSSSTSPHRHHQYQQPSSAGHFDHNNSHGGAVPFSNQPIDLSGVPSWWKDAIGNLDDHHAVLDDAAEKERRAHQLLEEELSVISSNEMEQDIQERARASLAAMRDYQRRNLGTSMPKQIWYPSGNPQQQLHPKFSALKTAILHTHESAESLRDECHQRTISIQHQQRLMLMAGSVPRPDLMLLIEDYTAADQQQQQHQHHHQGRSQRSRSAGTRNSSTGAASRSQQREIDSEPPVRLEETQQQQHPQ